MEKLYRYEYDRSTEHYIGSINPILHEFEVLNHTPKGLFIKISRKKRFILNSAKNKYAYATPELAMKGFINRQHNMIKILQRQIDIAKAYIIHCENYKLKEA